MIKEIYYGYPLLFYSYIIILPFFIILITIFLIIWNISFVAIMIMMVFLLLSSWSGLRYKKIIDHQRKYSIDKMIHLANIQGDEKVLDLGTGAGVIAIHFAKHLNKGIVCGLDRWRWPFSILASYLLPTVISGVSLKNAKKNAELQKVLDRCIFVTGSFTEKLDFSDNYFDIICSSQSLYFIMDEKKRRYAFSEINRILKKGGKIIFYEPVNYHYNWNIDKVKTFFEHLGYQVDITLLPIPKKWTKQCILHGSKN